jgi:hypothetical protein
LVWREEDDGAAARKAAELFGSCQEQMVVDEEVLASVYNSRDPQ